MKVLAIDPGKTTGFSLTPQRGVIDLWQTDYSVLSPGSPHLTFHAALAKVMPDVIVCERFDFRQNKTGVDYTPIEYIGVVELYCQQTGTPLYYQGQDVKSKKSFWDDKKLKHLGLFQAGDEYKHAMDALRHRLHWEERHGLFDLHLLRDL